VKYHKASIDSSFKVPSVNLLSFLDQTGNPVIQQLTPQVAPVIQKVLSPPEEQLDDETREQLVQLVKWLQTKG
jgi:hypothetical protein